MIGPAIVVALAVSAAPLPPPADQPIAVDIPAPAAADQTQAANANAGVPPSASGNEIVVLAVPHSDPAEAVNKETFAATQAVDKAVIAPVAMGYKHAVPEPVRDGVHNVIVNLNEPVVALSFLLELKPGKALKTLGRFAINSTIGIAGLLDVAKKKPFDLPHQPNGIADVLGYYGVGPGPYMFLPLLGPTSVRDLVGHFADLSIMPMAIGKPLSDPAVSTTRAVLFSLDRRVRDDAHIRDVREHSSNPYAAMRDDYLAKRRAEIAGLHGKSSPGTEQSTEASPADR